MRLATLRVLPLLACSLVLTAGAGYAQTLTSMSESFGLPDGPTKVPVRPISFDLNSLDKTADPCTDFFQYACGKWVKNNPIPADQVRWGTFNQLAESNAYTLYQEFKAASEAPKTPLQKKYGDYFAACMNTDLTDKLGAKPLQPELAFIDSLKDKKDLATFNVTAENKFDSAYFFGIGVGQDQVDSTKQILMTGQGGLTLPDRDYYLTDDARSKTLRDQYVAHVTKMFTLLGDSPELAAREAADVLRIETALAQGSMARVDLRDPAKRYHIMTIAETEALSPDYKWSEYLKGMHVSAPTMNVSSPGYVKTVNTVLETEDLAAIKHYMRWHALHNAAATLSQNFIDEDFNFFSATLAGQKEQTPRWKRCSRRTDAALGEAVGQDWVKQYFPPSAKDNMEKLVAALERAMAEDIRTIGWMSDETKVEAKKKLDAFKDKIGYPEHWRDYSKLTVKRDDFLGNVERNGIFERERNLKKLGQPVDEKEWGMTPPTVNAYYQPSMNDINFPAGILQPPFYDNSIDPAVNFGGIGVVIGHEMTHGFDDQGAKYGPTGNVKDWWTPADKKNFNERTDCEVKEYSGFKVAEGQNLNGKLTLGENTADNGGIRIAFQALQETIAKSPQTALAGYTDGKRDGFTPEQRFFISFGQIWCGASTEQSARMLAKTDPHSSGEWRVKGTVQNFEEFGKAFGCKVGQPMMPANACRVW
ncbi:putative endopeptidase [Granulicella pectinivorans]|jgi:putative endopeptidase|uniref:Putative endopeptidase n=1 Tax=Granulicella pectinivorans TaxID=474950 RepID=A0A1I6MZP3_9BACT|nr:M13 family metallopeptidase [Granulicella pectinivorans]SFS21028.1 putative endopeptidase [Granulicella pectinivorans]